MQLRALLIIVAAVAACASAPTPTPTLLPSDATFLRPDVPQCLATEGSSPNNEYACCQVLTLYAGGAIAELSAEDGFYGTYDLDGDVARGTLAKNPFAFDLTTDTATTTLGMAAGTWIPDTDNLNAIACLP